MQRNQMLMQNEKFFWCAPLSRLRGHAALFCPLYEVVTEIGFDHVAQIADFHGKGRRFEFGHHLSMAELTQIATLGA